MRTMSYRRARRGTALVLFVVSLVPIVGFMAFAIDVGMLTVAQTQLRDAADAAALAGCRALNGNTANNNYSGAAPAAQTAITKNAVLGSALTTAQLTVNVGRYAYNSATHQFEGNFPGTTGNWNMVQAIVSANLNNSLGFGRIFNLTLRNFQATATAAHRPRDVCLILDFSGSMGYGSRLGLNGGAYGVPRNCNNMDTVYPVWGHYSSTAAGMQATSQPASPCLDSNITWTTSDGRPPIVADFYTNATGSPAFSAASTTCGTAVAGDTPLKTSFNTGAGYAQTAAQVLNIASPTNSTYDATWEAHGYDYDSTKPQMPPFNRYTQGPGYYGKTFWIWPPDPSIGSDGQSNDWRKRYFTYWGSTTPLDDNSLLWDNSGTLRAPGPGAYAINYSAVLNFIKNIGPNPFPSQLQSGRIVYYSSIPDSIDTSTWPPADLNQRFWKDYIDYVFGVAQTGGSSYTVINNDSTGATGYGEDFAWGTVKITAKSSLSQTGNPPKPYMHYADNPPRPRLSFWFGPLTMVDFLDNFSLFYSGYVSPCTRYCLWPGTCHEAPLYACKLGIQAALNDIKNNHPSDYVSLIMFCGPKTSASESDDHRFNRVRVPLSQNYTNLTDALWYPPSTYGQPNATVTPYDTNNVEVPHAQGPTCYAMALMLAYNQFSCNSSLLTYNQGSTALSGDAGGNGRKGAQKIIIFETDGAPNTTASANFNNNGSYQSYYSIRYNDANPGGSEYPNNVTQYSDNDSTVTSQINTLCQQLAASDSGTGYSTSTRPLLIHCLAFGPQGTDGLATLKQMQQTGNVNDGMPAYKVINGNTTTIVANLQAAIKAILQDGVQVSLIQ